MPLPQLTPVTALVGLVGAVWAGATIGLVAHTMAPTQTAGVQPRTTVVVSPPPSSRTAVAGTVPDRVERALTGGVSAGVSRTTQFVTGTASSPSPTPSTASPSPSRSAVPSPSPSASASTEASASATPSPVDASPSASPGDPSPSPSASGVPKRGRTVSS